MLGKAEEPVAMSESISTNMLCPKCGAFQPMADICTACGIIFAKIRDLQTGGDDALERTGPGNRCPSRRLDGHELDRERTMTQVVALAIGIVACSYGYLLNTPVEMDLYEFVAAKNGSIHIRNFLIEGTVAPEPQGSYIRTKSSDGQNLASLKLSGNDTTGYVTFDPREIEQELNAGDFVQVTGRFERVPYYDGRNQMRKITMAFASSIDVIDSAH